MCYVLDDVPVRDAVSLSQLQTTHIPAILYRLGTGFTQARCTYITMYIVPTARVVSSTDEYARRNHGLGNSRAPLKQTNITEGTGGVIPPTGVCMFHDPTIFNFRPDIHACCGDNPLQLSRFMSGHSVARLRLKKLL